MEVVSNKKASLNLKTIFSTKKGNQSVPPATKSSYKWGSASNEKLSLSPEDVKYFEAIHNNDMETVQRMVDEAAKEKGFDTKVHRGTNN